MSAKTSSILKTNLKLDVGPAQPRVDATFTSPQALPEKVVVFVFGHGIMNDKDHPLLAAPLDLLAENGFCGLRFNFPFKQKGVETVDERVVLMETISSAIGWVRTRLEGHELVVIIGGKSLGARMAAAYQAETKEADGLVYLGYPLHRPESTERLRDSDLYKIQVPQLFITGEKDPYCREDLLQKVLDKIASPKNNIIIPDGDHGLGITQSGDDSQSLDIINKVADETGKWSRSHFV